jgi:CTP synthase (UTP-ammonia lyase)
MYTVLFVVVPHITDQIQEWVQEVASMSVSEEKIQPDVRIYMILTTSLESLESLK